MAAHMTLNHRGQSSSLCGGTNMGVWCQRLAQQTFNLPSLGSNPSAPTIIKAHS